MTGLTGSRSSWTSQRVADTYLEFFRAREHLVLPSSSLVPENDPTVLLTTAGVQQFIPYFLGRQAPPSRRLCSVQKCFRTTDIADVGDLSHNTFFEMLGNFAIGDYFKEQMVPWAFELVTQGYGIPLEKLWVTVHPSDEEARRLWEAAGLPGDRIVTDESNFWGPPGASGPCGPDTELYYDWGPSVCGDKPCCGLGKCFPSCDCDRFLEFWNLVFTEFFQDADGSRVPLAQRNIDTGSGLERVARILQGVGSAYETDVFLPILRAAQDLLGAQYGASESTDQALRVIADHGRAMTFLVGDGVLPSNEGRGYVLRRIIRRAVRFGRRLGAERPFLEGVVAAVVGSMGSRYPALAPNLDHLKMVIRTEEQRFLSTLQSGLSLLDLWIEEARGNGRNHLDGEQVFRLYDTYGFPRELSEEILKEAGLSVAADEYDRALQAQRERSRGAGRFSVSRPTGETDGIVGQPATDFRGYETLDLASPILAVEGGTRGQSALAEGEAGSVVLAETPFYAEGGGQVGDTGEIITPHGTFQVEDTKRDSGGHILHIGRMLRGELAVGDASDARVDVERRRDIMRHHSATHLLHKALHVVLGPTAMQAGSLVAPNMARFDFPNDGPVTEEQLAEIEDLVNREILADLPVKTEELPFQEAVSRGAMAFFGEKYGDRVRVVSMADFSQELCGGTHVSTTGELGATYIATESGIGSGIRRVEFVAGRAAHALARTRSRQMSGVASLLGAAADQIEDRIRAVLDELKEARRTASHLEATVGQAQATGLMGRVEQVGDLRLVSGRVDATTSDGLLLIKDAVQILLQDGVIILGALIDGQPQFVASVSPTLVRPGFDAVRLIREVAAIAGGGGGGKPELARAGGKDAAKLDAALDRAPEIVRAALAS
ncbi:MAG: alanine--tRNA ligase [Chloroflexi bacterium]|nr:alanine--tRNA ligase [Chloroflexota bacterium]